MHRPVGYHRTSGGNGIRRGCSNGRVRHPFRHLFRSVTFLGSHLESPNKTCINRTHEGENKTKGRGCYGQSAQRN